MKPCILIAAALVAGCSSIETMSGGDVRSSVNEPCNVRIYGTYQQAIEAGPITELCVISGTSSPSFSHTVATAIDKHKHKACACGAKDAYIQSRSGTGGWSVATVTLVAFKRK